MDGELPTYKLKNSIVQDEILPQILFILLLHWIENKTSSKTKLSKMRSPIPPIILEIFSIVPMLTMLVVVTKKSNYGIDRKSVV